MTGLRPFTKEIALEKGDYRSLFGDLAGSVEIGGIKLGLSRPGWPESPTGDAGNHESGRSPTPPSRIRGRWFGKWWAGDPPPRDFTETKGNCGTFSPGVLKSP